MSEGQNPSDMVKGPGLGLLIVGILGICIGLLGLLASLLGFGAAHMAEAQDQGQQLPEWSKYYMSGGPVQLVMNVVGIAASVFVVYAGLQMQKLQSRTLCTIGAIVAMIPCISPCCPLGLPIGIWALIVLNKAEVRAAFAPPSI